MVHRTAMLKRTQQLIAVQTPVIAEATFSYDGNYCAVDLLRHTSDGWVIYEVKSTTADSSEDACFEDSDRVQLANEHEGVWLVDNEFSDGIAFGLQNFEPT